MSFSVASSARFPRNPDPTDESLFGLKTGVSKSLKFLFLLLFSLQFWIQIYSQSATASLSGTVVDEAGALVAGAAVTVKNLSTSGERTTLTNGSGNFVIPFLPPTHYSIKIRQKGFSAAEIKDLELNVNDQINLRIQLKVGEVTETVMVEANDSLVRTDSPAVGTVINRRLVETLPLNGRSFQSLVALVPGVVMTYATSAGQFSVNGQRSNANYFTVDGVSANFGTTSPFTLGGNVPATSSTGGTNGLVSVEALQEFSVQTSGYAAEFGRSPGAQVSVITRSGTNQYRGSLYEYFRNDALDANDWFANSQGLKKPPLRHNNFGGGFGGPVIRSRTFFFISYEGLRLRQPVTAITTVPSLSLRQTAPAYLQPLLNSFPIPNGRILNSTKAEFAAGFANPRTIDSISLRLDQKISDKLSIFGRYNYAPSQTETRQGAFNTVNRTNFRIETLTLGLTQTMAAKATNELRFNYSTSRTFGRTTLDYFGGAVPPPDSVLYPSPFASAKDSGFRFAVDGASISTGLGGSRQRQLNLIDTVSNIRGNHLLRFGIDYRRLSPIRSNSKYSQSITTTGKLAFIGTASTVTISSFIGDVFPIFTNFSAFGQDTWTVTPGLTLTYGLRWELNPYPREKFGNDPLTTTGGLEPAQITLAPKGTRLWKTPYTNFAPRIGAAYLLFGQSGRETVLRGGFGLFYDLGTGNASFAFNPGNFPYTRRKTLRNVSLPLTQTLAEPPALNLDPPYQNLSVFDPDLKTPRTYQWSFGVQQGLGSRRSFSVQYVGAAGRQLESDQNVSFYDPLFAQLRIIRSTGTSDYHALQAQFDRRFASRLELTASYTWGHSIDTSSGESSFLLSVDPIELRNNRADSDFDVRHSFSTGLTYDLPGLKTNKLITAMFREWSVSTIIITRTAMPLFEVGALGSGFDRLENGLDPRPDLVPGVPVYLTGSQYPGGRRLNPQAFAYPPDGRQGTLPRNALRGFPVFQMDMSLRRNFKIGEKLEIQLMAEAFNILNHPNFGDPLSYFFGEPDFDDVFFGISYQMLNQGMSNPWGAASQPAAGLNPVFQIGGPRSIQFGLKIKF